jgi:Protein of unknown function (DUF2796).
MKNALVLAACAVLLTAAPAFAHGAHEHGVARLNVAVDGSTVDIDLESPLANPLSFEHAPSTPEQRQAVQDMAVNLHRAENIFVFPAAAQCRLKSVTLESEALPADLLQAVASPQPQTSAAKGAQPGAATGDGHGQHDGHEQGAEHADLDASFAFECAHPEALHGMDVRLFAQWPALHELRVQLVTPAGQHAAELTGQAHQLSW